MFKIHFQNLQSLFNVRFFFRIINIFLFLSNRVVFPKILDLNSFIPNVNSAAENYSVEDREAIVKCDDCSTTDSGSALDDESCQGTDASSTVNGQDDSCQDDDEGMLISYVSIYYTYHL